MSNDKDNLVDDGHLEEGGSDQGDKHKEAFTRRDFLHNSAAAMTGVVLVGGMTRLAATAAQAGDVLETEELRSNSVAGLHIDQHESD